MEKVINKNDEFEVIISDLGMNGEGICKIDGQTVFVPFAMVGEKVKIKIINVKSKIAIGKVLEILEKSPDRVEPKCPYFTKCGGCDIQHIDYQKTLEFKTKEVAKNLKNIGKIDAKVEKCIASSSYFYRNKCSLPVVNDGGITKIGMFRENSHKLVEITDCVVTKPFVAKLIEIFDKYFKKFNIFGYNEETGEGQVKHIVARMVGDNLIVTLVSSTFDLNGLDWLYEKLKENFNCSLWLNLNNKPTNVIFGKNFKFLYGEKINFAEILGLKVSINPASFMQINDEVRDKIYLKVLDEIDENYPVIDAFSGAGVMSCIVSKKSSKVYAIEIIPEACEDAEILAKNNKIDNLSVFCGDCTEILPKIAENLKNEKYAVILDPPRKGCSNEVMEALAKTNPEKIIYISCNSATLARDVRHLLDKNPNYKIKLVQPYDMFPQTRHIETLLILDRISN